MNEQNLPKVGSKLMYIGYGPPCEVTVIDNNFQTRHLSCIVIKFEDGKTAVTLASQLRPLPKVKP